MCRASPGVRRTWIYLSSGLRPANVPAYRYNKGDSRSRAFAVARQRKVDCTIACGRITAYVCTCEVYIQHKTARPRPHRVLGKTKVPQDITARRRGIRGIRLGSRGGRWRWTGERVGGTQEVLETERRYKSPFDRGGTTIPEE